MGNNIIRKIYRYRRIKKVQDQLDMLGDKNKMDAITFYNYRYLTTIIVFFLVLYNTNLGYITAPLAMVLYYYGFYYVFITKPKNERIRKLDHEALYFFEILTLTLESGRNLESSIEATVMNVDSELSKEFKQALVDVKFGKTLLEALEDMKKRIPSETVNNIILNITQTSVFGNSILETMYNQIDFLREKQILEIKGEINKIPNKISIISVLFVVPLILLMILGPFIIDFLNI